jgi:hypothetical protein
MKNVIYVADTILIRASLDRGDIGLLAFMHPKEGRHDETF